jgi:hypothetical protein
LRIGPIWVNEWSPASPNSSGGEEGLIFEIWMCGFDHTSNTINLVTAPKYTAFGVMEYCIFVKDVVDCSATTHGVIFAKYVADYEAARSICCRTFACLDARIEGKLQQDAVC